MSTTPTTTPASQLPGLAEASAEPLPARAGSVISVRYLVDVQSLSGIWQNVEIRATEEAAREKEAEWKEWLTENRKTWKDIRIVKESTVQEVLQNN
jgi:hypothetical protein